MWLSPVEESNQRTTQAISMTPSKPQYPEDKGFLTVLADDAAQSSTQLTQFISDGAGDISDHGPIYATFVVPFMIHISGNEVIV